MPKIRSITYFDNLNEQSAVDTFSTAGQFLETAKVAFKDFDVQTCRFASQPFPHGLTDKPPSDLPSIAADLYAKCQAHAINYLSLGPVSPSDDRAYLDVLPDVFAAAPGVFATSIIADKQGGISLPMLQATAEMIVKTSSVTSDGMTNLYFAALANCEAGSPFFPVAYHDGDSPAFALAIQSADLAVAAFQGGTTPAEAKTRLQASIQATADAITPIAKKLSEQFGIRFLGLDLSLAPYPIDAESLGGALEGLGAQFGMHGLIASASLVMNAIEAADFPKTGFCGLMLPILEDSVLGRRAAEGKLSMNDLLLLSSVCGTGLDCIPLPGATPAHALRDILLDVAALSLRLDKPLTARLMPFPEKVAGDSVEFAFEFFTNSRVLSLNYPQSSKWDDETSIMIRSRR